MSLEISNPLKVSRRYRVREKDWQGAASETEKKKKKSVNKGKGREESISRRAYFSGVFRMLLRG